ncbi:carbohydrate kinase family protein [Candidatus Uhrbacteria bacterium]|nr:carbohydrate kinase family protein [Candidatus Uhrbacteria bacterium]
MRRKVVCLPSMNVEVSAPVTAAEFRVIQAQNPRGIRRDAKNSVRGIDTFDAPMDHSGGVGFIITLATGERVNFVATGTTPIAGGSSSNIAHALVALDIQDVGLVGAVGDDAHGRHIISTLHQSGLSKLTLFRREATATSLILREPDGVATLFACKPPYHTSPEILAKLTDVCQAEVLVVSGVRWPDFPLVQALWQAASPRVRALSPHISLVADSDENRQHCLELCKNADIVHLNDDEAAHLFQLRGASGRIAFPDDDQQAEQMMRQHVAPLGAHIFCITRGERGSITYDNQHKRVVLQAVPERIEGGNRVGAGDVHLTTLIYYLYLRGRTIDLLSALKVAARVTAAKIAAGDSRPWAGIPDSATRKPWVREAEARNSAS